MDLQDKWEKALKKTEIVKYRSEMLSPTRTSELPYMLLSESIVNIGDTLVRKGKVFVHKPSIILPNNIPQFEGFEFQKDYEVDDDTMRTFLLLRGISLPSMEYRNEVAGLEVYDGSLKDAIKHFLDKLEWKEDIETALIAGPEDCWQFSILVYIAGMITRSAPDDVKKFLNDLKKKGHLN